MGKLMIIGKKLASSRARSSSSLSKPRQSRRQRGLPPNIIQSSQVTPEPRPPPKSKRIQHRRVTPIRMIRNGLELTEHRGMEAIAWTTFHWHVPERFFGYRDNSCWFDSTVSLLYTFYCRYKLLFEQLSCRRNGAFENLLDLFHGHQVRESSSQLLMELQIEKMEFFGTLLGRHENEQFWVDWFKDILPLESSETWRPLFLSTDTCMHSESQSTNFFFKFKTTDELIGCHINISERNIQELLYCPLCRGNLYYSPLGLIFWVDFELAQPLSVYIRRTRRVPNCTKKNSTLNIFLKNYNFFIFKNAIIRY